MAAKQPYDPPREDHSRHGELASIRFEDVVAFSAEGPKGYYAEEFERQASGSKSRFNKAALFFGSNWLFFRKLYFLAVPVSAAELTMSGLYSYLVARYLPSVAEVPASPLFFLPILLVLRIPLGMIANGLVSAKLRGLVQQADIQAMGPEERAAWLKKRGGTRFVFVLVNTVVGALSGLLVGTPPPMPIQ